MEVQSENVESLFPNENNGWVAPKQFGAAYFFWIENSGRTTYVPGNSPSFIPRIYT